MNPLLSLFSFPFQLFFVSCFAQTGIGSSLLTCAATDTLENAITLFAVAAGRTERIICVDAERRVTGVVSLSDIFAYIVQDAT